MPYGLQSIDDLVLRGQRLLALIEEMRRHGYLVKPGQKKWDHPHLYLFKNQSLAFGRHANHRIAIARELGMRTIPVRFGGIHAVVMDEIARNAYSRDEIIQSALQAFQAPGVHGSARFGKVNES